MKVVLVNSISFETINNSIKEIDQLGSFEACWSNIELMGNRQPHLVGLLLQVGNDSLEEHQYQHLMILALVVWKSFTKTYSGIREIPASNVLEDFKQHSKNFVNLSADHSAQVDTYLSAESDLVQKNVLDFLIEEIFPAQNVKVAEAAVSKSLPSLEPKVNPLAAVSPTAAQEKTAEELRELSVIFMLLTFFAKELNQYRIHPAADAN